MLANLALGKAGELRVASELLIRGHEVFFTLVDSGADLILGNGKRIQVKASHQKNCSLDGHYYPRYTFSFKSWKKKAGCYEPHSLEGIDFVILWAIEHDEFFVMPTEAIRGKYSVRLQLTGVSHSIYLGFKAKWDLLNQ